MEDKTVIIIGIILLCIVSLMQAAGASYSFDGVPYPDKLELVAQGSLQGGIYVGEARGLGFPPYEQTFGLPEVVTVKWARLYVGVWGGTERYEGWVQTTFNGHNLGKTPLRGINDDNPQVYCSSHGSYWIYYDVTDKVISGLNTGIAETSRGERGNKLDGRVYGIILVAVYEVENEPGTSYWVCDGNPSLHGLGWAGAIPTINDFASVQFNDTIDPANVETAQLTVAYLAGDPGEPDYLDFNGHEIGGNDVANNADGETYGIDLKTFDVTRYVEASNNLLFLRGKDLNGDGKIDVDDEGKLEGEYYLHPVLAVLAVEHKTPEKTVPDFTVQLEFGNLTEGENILRAVVNNYGSLYEQDIRLTVLVDNSEIYSDLVRMDASGIKRVTIPWNAAYGTHTIRAEIDADNAVQELSEKNNVFSSDVHIGGSPDVSVRILTPVREQKGSIMARCIVTAGSGLIGVLPLFFVLSRRGAKRKIPVALVIMGLLSVALVTCGCVDKQSGGKEIVGGGMLKYSVPVELTNEGKLPAADFELALYIDGEKSALTTIERLEGGTSITTDFAIVVTEGTHTVKAVADERNELQETRRENNVDEITFEF